LIDQAKPKTIIEVGTHSGARAVMMCRRAMLFHPEVHYTGYDLFEEATPESNSVEMNGKGAGSMAVARQKLEGLREANPAFAYRLVKGNTRDTLHGRQIMADFVFIDGGHSLQTIRGDYEALKGSKVIVFDDYYLSGPDTSKYGCNEVIKGLPHKLLPQVDRFGDLAVKMVVLT
jgi:predicted O-methyltransferase YrrM